MFVLGVMITGVPKPATADAGQVTPQAAYAGALEQARQTGSPAEIDSALTEDSTLSVNPDGTLTLEVSAGPVRVQDPEDPSKWLDIDPSLKETKEGLQPQATAANVTFSLGGLQELVELQVGNLQYGLEWPKSLPTPTVSGATATYPEVLPGIDLVMTATADGFAQSFTVKKPPTAPLVIQFPMKLAGVDPILDQYGRLTLADSSGSRIGGADAPQMWDASMDPKSLEPTHQAAVPIQIVDGKNGQTLQLSPDPAFFQSSDLTYPVTIDPTVYQATVDGDVLSSSPDTAFPTWQYVRSGWSGTGIARSLFQFDVSALSGQQILGAQLKLYETWSSSCTPSPVDVYRLDESFDASTTWNTLAAATTSFGTLTTARGYSSQCPAGWITIVNSGPGGRTIRDLVQSWANGAENDGVLVRASDESTPSGWKRFASLEGGVPAQLVVNFTACESASIPVSSPPLVPTNLSTDVQGFAPVLHATYLDSAGSNGQVVYTIRDSVGQVVACAEGGPLVTHGTDSPFEVPDSIPLVDGQTYSWTARSYNGAWYSSGTAAQWFVFNPKGQTSSPAPYSSAVDLGAAGAEDLGTQSTPNAACSLASPPHISGGAAPNPPAPSQSGLTYTPPAGGVSPPIQTPTGWTEFQGLNLANTGGLPGDPVVAAGSDGLILMTNQDVAKVSKTGVCLWAMTVADFFDIPGILISNVSPYDPWGVYNRGTSQYFLTVIAISTATTVGYVYEARSFDQGATWSLRRTNVNLNNPGVQWWPDFDKAGVNSDAYYVTANLFTFPQGPTSTFVGAYLYVIKTDWSKVWRYALEDRPGQAAVFLQPAQEIGSPGIEYLASHFVDQYGSNNIDIWKVTCCDPVITNYPVLISTVQSPPVGGATQPGTSTTVDALDARLTNGTWRNGNLWTAHPIQVGTTVHYSGIAIYSVNTGDYPHVNNRWVVDYSASFQWAYLPAVTTNSDGNQTLVFTLSSGANGGSWYPSVFTWRRINKVWQTTVKLQKEGLGPALDLIDENNRSRWGDYSGISPDADGRDWVVSPFGDAQTPAQIWVSGSPG